MTDRMQQGDAGTKPAYLVAVRTIHDAAALKEYARQVARCTSSSAARTACLGSTLILGLWTRWSALGSGGLLLLFALGMTVGTGVKSALNASVFSASAAAFALSAWPAYVGSVDALRQRASTPQW